MRGCNYILQIMQALNRVNKMLMVRVKLQKVPNNFFRKGRMLQAGLMWRKRINALLFDWKIMHSTISISHFQYLFLDWTLKNFYFYYFDCVEEKSNKLSYWSVWDEIAAWKFDAKWTNIGYYLQSLYKKTW